MKIICNEKDLLRVVNIVSKAVPGRTTMPVLECILIDASSSEIKFTANDMELGIETKIKGTIDEKGIVALNAKLFSDIIHKLPENDVTIETEENENTRISCEKAVFNIPGLKGDDFPYLPFVDKNYRISISQFTLREVIQQTIFSVSSNDTNKMMTGELFEIKDGLFSIISLDGHRISIRNIMLKEEYEDKKVIVPGKTLNEISKILTGDTEDIVDIYITDNLILFEFDDIIVVSRLIEGKYFRVDQMISNDYETKIKVNRQNLMNCIDRATLMVKEGDRRPIILNVKNNIMEMKISSQIGAMDESLEIELEGKEIKIGFNPRFLLDVLRVIDDETIDIYFINSKAPCFIRNEKQTYIYLVLPVNFVE